jgi:hypothetical protein
VRKTVNFARPRQVFEDFANIQKNFNLKRKTSRFAYKRQDNSRSFEINDLEFEINQRKIVES